MNPDTQPRPATRRPAFHFSVPDNWKNDPQRPIHLAGEYLYYYLYNGDYLAGGIGTSWRLATTRDHVAFVDRGVAIPKFSNGNGDCWSGSLIVDTGGTAGFGAGAIVALVTQARVDAVPEGRQAQYLWYSTDGGRSFRSGGDDPVLDVPGIPDFRDPKVIWDAERGRWFLALAEGDRLGFYASTDLRTWDRVGEFARDDLGLLECPDIFSMTADDGSTTWVLGVSANAKHRGLPATYAYWTGAFDGRTFVPDAEEPRWLDWGFDFYGAVTYPHHGTTGAEDPGLRHVIGWANFWDYPHNTPTIDTDGYNGDDMIVRDLRLVRDERGYRLISAPTAALADYVTTTHLVGDVEVSAHVDLDVSAVAYDLECDVSWSASTQDVGVQVCRAPGGTRFVAAGLDVTKGSAYLDRSFTANPTRGRSEAPFDPTAGSVRLRVLVDRTSVEVFVADGETVQSHRVFPLSGDERVRLYSSGGAAVFRDVTVRELEVGPRRDGGAG
ncbi:levanase [Microbacterium testaceum]|uniref:glycoside hydrolase family 32 protein n=1 Tax=Microbacterium testaceum TaxID=2033 RepID=UPI000734A6CE|nr:GH32 C-terminal domain-containing protein [Microbacterium testaceum]KTS91136.1 levanase [Microbacterium testaceum]